MYVGMLIYMPLETCRFIHIPIALQQVFIAIVLVPAIVGFTNVSYKYLGPDEPIAYRNSRPPACAANTRPEQEDCGRRACCCLTVHPNSQNACPFGPPLVSTTQSQLFFCTVY
jgi:hypothetical protein